MLLCVSSAAAMIKSLGFLPKKVQSVVLWFGLLLCCGHGEFACISSQSAFCLCLWFAMIFHGPLCSAHGYLFFGSYVLAHRVAFHGETADRSSSTAFCLCLWSVLVFLGLLCSARSGSCLGSGTALFLFPDVVTQPILDEVGEAPELHVFVADTESLSSVCEGAGRSRWEVKTHASHQVDSLIFREAQQVDVFPQVQCFVFILRGMYINGIYNAVFFTE